MASSPWWTVSAVYADTEEGFVVHVQARDAETARGAAYRSADSVITIANVFEGKLTPALEPTNDITPLKGRGHAVAVVRVDISRRQVVVPSRCPGCRADLRKTAAVLQGDLALRVWKGHLAKTGDELAAERDHASHMRDTPVAEATRLRCVACGKSIWDGIHREKV